MKTFTIIVALMFAVPVMGATNEFSSVAIIKSPVIMKGIYGSKGSRSNAFGVCSTEVAVMRSLRWLKTTQNDNGSWNTKDDPATLATGLALATFLAHGETPASHEFGTTVEASIKYLLSSQDTNGLFQVTNDAPALQHAIATWAMADAYGLTKIPRLKKAAENAAAFIIGKQRSSGLWHEAYTLEGDSDHIETSVWQFRALKACWMAGLESDTIRPALHNAAEALRESIEANQPSKKTGPAVFCLQLVGYRNDKQCKAGLTAIDDCSINWSNPDYNNPVYHWHYISKAKFMHGGESWKSWNKSFAPALVSKQLVEKEKNQKECGYWISPGAHERYGVIYSTALCSLMLQSYYHYLPTYKTDPFDVRSNKEKNAPDKDIEITID